MMPILILAAGASSRMRGRDKLAIEIDGVTLLRRQARMARAVSKDVRIALPARAHARYELVQDLDVRCVDVKDASDGISASLRTLFGTLEANITHAMILLADLPEINGDDLHMVMQAVQTHPNAALWRGATAAGNPGHPMVIPRSLFDGFQMLTGDSGGNSIIKAAGDSVHLVRLKDDRARRDLDTPEDWEAWRAARTSAPR